MTGFGEMIFQNGMEQGEKSIVRIHDENGEILAGGDFCHHRGFHGDRGKNLRGTGIWGGTPRLTKI